MTQSAYKGLLRSKLSRYELPKLTLRTPKLIKMRLWFSTQALTWKKKLFANTSNIMALLLEQYLFEAKRLFWADKNWASISCCIYHVTTSTLFKCTECIKNTLLYSIGKFHRNFSLNKTNKASLMCWPRFHAEEFTSIFERSVLTVGASYKTCRQHFSCSLGPS